METPPVLVHVPTALKVYPGKLVGANRVT